MNTEFLSFGPRMGTWKDQMKTAVSMKRVYFWIKVGPVVPVSLKTRAHGVWSWGITERCRWGKVGVQPFVWKITQQFINNAGVSSVLRGLTTVRLPLPPSRGHLLCHTNEAATSVLCLTGVEMRFFRRPQDLALLLCALAPGGRALLSSSTWM